MKQRMFDLARPSGVVAPILLALFFASAIVANAAVTNKSVIKTSSVDPRIVQVPRALDADGDRINDSLETAVAKADFKSMPYAVMAPRSAMAARKGMGQATATVVDVVISLDHAPTAADLAAMERLGFATKETYSHAVYAVHAIGPAPLGVQSLRNLVAAVKGVVYVEPNFVGKPLLEHSTQQIGARQSWTAFSGYNIGRAQNPSYGPNYTVSSNPAIGFTGDPDISIAIMDTGIDGTHPDLNGGTAVDPGSKILGWYDATAGKQSPTDTYGHGSIVAGIAAGTGISSDAGQPDGISNDPGFLPLTLRFASIGALSGNNTISEEPDDNIPINTNGDPYGITMPVSMYWTGGLVGATNEVNFEDYSNGTDSKDWGYAPFDGGATQPATTNIGVGGGLNGDIYASFHAYGGNYMGFAAHVLAPERPIVLPGAKKPDGFNLISGVAPTSSLVGVEAGDSVTGEFSESAVLSGLEYISTNQARYNIGVLNMSFGFTEIIPAVDSAVDNLVDQGIVCTVAAGNEREQSDAAAGLYSPATASAAITVAAVGNVNQIAEYSSYASGAQFKPDVSAPGGSYPFLGPTSPGNASTDYTHDEAITSVGSNTDILDEGDPDIAGAIPLVIPNRTPNSYENAEGTSMAAPHVAGAAALLEQALETLGAYGGLTPPTAGDEALLIKALLEMTCNDTNVAADVTPSPVVKHVGRDASEGFGKINVDAALSAVLNTYVPGETATATLGAFTGQNANFAPRVWAEHVLLKGGVNYVFTTAGSTDNLKPTEYDLFLYSGVPAGTGSVSNGASGDPYLITSSATADAVAQQIIYTPASDEVDVLVVAWQEGAGTFTLTSGYLTTLPTTTTETVTPIPFTPATETVNVLDATTNQPIANADVVLNDANSSEQENSGLTAASTNTSTTPATAVGQVTLTVPTTKALIVSATATGYYENSIVATPGITTIYLTKSAYEFPTGLQMVSVPYNLSASSLAAQTEPSVSTAAVWQPNYAAYAISPSYPADQFRVGQGYWVRFRQKTWLAAPGTAVSAAKPYSIPLSAGWNMVGCPFTAAAPMADATVTLGSTSESYATAVTKGDVGDLWSYNLTAGQYEQLTPTGLMEPWSGYWIYSATPATLVVSLQTPPPPPH